MKSRDASPQAILVLLLLAGPGCQDDLCKSRPPALEVTVKLGTGIDALAVVTLQVDVDVAGGRCSQISTVRVRGSYLTAHRSIVPHKIWLRVIPVHVRGIAPQA